MSTRRDLNLKCNYSSSRDLVETVPYYIVKNEASGTGLTQYDMEELGRYEKILRERKAPLSVIMNGENGLPTYNELKSLLVEKTKEDGAEFADRLAEIEYDVVWAEHYKDVADAEDGFDMKKSQVLIGLLNNKTKRMNEAKEVNNNTQINIFDGVDPDVLRRLKLELGNG
jgi:hypothetical protein